LGPKGGEWRTIRYSLVPGRPAGVLAVGAPAFAVSLGARHESG